MPYTYVTFGQEHEHVIDSGNDTHKHFHKNVIAKLECRDAVDGRYRAFRLFGQKFAFEYHEDEFQRQQENLKEEHGREFMAFFPGGFVEVPIKESEPGFDKWAE